MIKGTKARGKKSQAKKKSGGTPLPPLAVRSTLPASGRATREPVQAGGRGHHVPKGQGVMSDTPVSQGNEESPVARNGASPPGGQRDRAYQREVFLAASGRIRPMRIDGQPIIMNDEALRCWFLLWLRQGGKSTFLAKEAMYEMLFTPGRLVTYASASLLLGRELIAKESQFLYQTLQDQAQALATDAKFEAVNGATGKALPANIDADALAEVFEARKLEFKLHFSNTKYSRTQVIAPNPATARGWSGTVILDEFGFIPDLKDLWEAVEPIISSNRAFKFIGATTPPADDAHFSYELTQPPVGTSFPVNAKGNWYLSEAGELIHRVSIYDSAAAGKRVYDRRTGREISVEEHYREATDKDAWRRNYNIEHVRGGTSAVGLAELDTAQTRGAEDCRTFIIDHDDDLQAALDWLFLHLDDGPVGIGFDVATTTNEKSNPSAIAILEGLDAYDWAAKCVVVWKTRDPAVAIRRAEALVIGVARRAHGGRAKAFNVDSSNERYFATDLVRALRKYVAVNCIAGGDKYESFSAEEMNWKQYLGNALVNEFQMNRGAIPPDRYIRNDIRLVKRDKGTFVTDTGDNGEHGDTFDAIKLALEALRRGGAFEAFEGANPRGIPRRDMGDMAASRFGARSVGHRRGVMV